MPYELGRALTSPPYLRYSGSRPRLHRRRKTLGFPMNLGLFRCRALFPRSGAEVPFPVTVLLSAGQSPSTRDHRRRMRTEWQYRSPATPGLACTSTTDWDRRLPGLEGLTWLKGGREAKGGRPAKWPSGYVFPLAKRPPYVRISIGVCHYAVIFCLSPLPP